MNILIVTESFPPHCGGSGWSTLQLVKALQKNHRVTVVHLGGTHTNYEKIPVIPLRSGRSVEYFPFLLRKKIANIITKTKADVIHAQHLRSAFAVPQDTKAKKIVTIRDYWPVCYDGTLFNTKNQVNISPGILPNLKKLVQENKLMGLFTAPFFLWRTWKAKKTVNRFDTVICVSNFVKKVMEEQGIKNLFTVPNMIDRDYLQNIPAKKTNTLLFVGKLEVSKGPHIALGAAKKLGLDIGFIGEGTMKKSLQEKNTTFYDYLSNKDVLSHMRGARVLVLPALWNEPLGRTLLEGAGIGAKIVATAAGGTPEILPDYPYLCKRTVDSCAEAIKGAMRDNTITEKMNKMAERYSPEKVTPLFEAVYKSDSK